MASKWVRRMEFACILTWVIRPKSLGSPNYAVLLLLLYRQRPETHEGLLVSSRPHIQRGRIRIFAFLSHDISAMFYYLPLSATIITLVSPGFPSSVSDFIVLSLLWLKPWSILSSWNLQLQSYRYILQLSHLVLNILSSLLLPQLTLSSNFRLLPISFSWSPEPTTFSSSTWFFLHMYLLAFK